MATVRVTNTSQRPGSEVAELYLQPPQTPGAPRLMLRGIERITLAPGQTRELTFTLLPDQLSTVDPAGARSVVSGAYKLFVGSTQPDLTTSQSTSFQVEAASSAQR